MAISLDKLQERKKALTDLLQRLNAQHEQQIADINGVLGSIQEVDFWISQIGPENPPSEVESGSETEESKKE